MSSSIFPFLNSLFRSPPPRSNDQHWVFQKIIQDRDRGGFTTPDRQQDHLSYHDAGLRGSKGAFIVLEALATNPFASRLTLSHNSLSDDGAKKLSSRAMFINSHRNNRIRELNLASNSISDLGFFEVLRGWSDISELYLSNNNISLAANPSPMLHLNRLNLLSLTSNPIDCGSIVGLFKDPNFAPEELRTLHLSACGLDLSVSFAIAGWLEDSRRSSSLEWLAVNGNNWGSRGCERIVWALARRTGNRNLLRLEMLSCDSPTPATDEIDLTPENSGLDAQELEELRSTMNIHGGWKALLEKCQTRNQVLKLATRRAALGVISVARTILISSPGPKSLDKGKFPFRELPEELQLLIFRWVGILSAFPGLEHQSVELEQSGDSEESINLIKVKGQKGFDLHQVDSSTLKKEEENWLTIPEPLTGIQLINSIRYAQDRESIQNEILSRVQLTFDYRNSTSSSSSGGGDETRFYRQMVEKQRMNDEADRLGRESLLKTCGCEKFKKNLMK